MILCWQYHFKAHNNLPTNRCLRDIFLPLASCGDADFLEVPARDPPWFKDDWLLKLWISSTLPTCSHSAPWSELIKATYAVSLFSIWFSDTLGASVEVPDFVTITFWENGFFLPFTRDEKLCRWHFDQTLHGFPVFVSQTQAQYPALWRTRKHLMSSASVASTIGFSLSSMFSRRWLVASLICRISLKVWWSLFLVRTRIKPWEASWKLTQCLFMWPAASIETLEKMNVKTPLWEFSLPLHYWQSTQDVGASQIGF